MIRPIFILIALLFILSIRSAGQTNLVPNYSFEEITDCPSSNDQLSMASFWQNCNWAGNADLFHTCALPINVGVPVNGLGYQNPATGNAYVGMMCYSGTNSIDKMNYREHIYAKLTQTMIVGRPYYVQFKVSLVDDTVNSGTASINKIGARFVTRAPIGSLKLNGADNISHISTNSIISDRTNWTSICGSFIADSAYQYIILGNFFSDDSTMAIRRPQPSVLGVYFSYYWFDDVIVSEIPIACESALSVKEKDNDINIKAFPNPTNEKIKFECNLCLINSILIQNCQGAEIKYVSKVDSSEYLLDIASFEAGVYLLKINYNGKSVYRRIIKI